nr:V-type ATP synthase subunit C [Sedimentibacter sp.]
MAKIKDTDYLFSSALVRSVEKNMLSKEKLEKMIDAKTADDALKVLYDCEYGNSKEQVAARDFEQLLEDEHKKTYDFIMSTAPELNNFNIFLYAYDYHNLKVIMKAEFLGIDASASLVDTGTVNVKILKYAIKERDFTVLTENMRNALNEVLDIFPKNKDPQIIDIVFDKYCYNEMLKSAEALNNQFVTEYVKMLIDTINIKTFVRLRKMGKSWDFFSKVFIDGGKIPQKAFVTSYDEPFENFSEDLIAYGFKDVFLEGTDELKETGKFTTLEKLCDNKLMEHIKTAKYISYGIEPLVGYLVAKENEIKSARIIMAGKLAEIPSDLIRGRLRETYV